MKTKNETKDVKKKKGPVTGHLISMEAGDKLMANNMSSDSNGGLKVCQER
jgi:hypothetical protein